MSPLDLIASQVDCERIALPTGARVFSRGSSVSAIYAVRRGLVELRGMEGEKTCFRPGELFSYQDILWRDGAHQGDAVARTPVDILRLDRLRFLNLVHNHPTLALLLIGQQHDRLREQRASGTCCY
jgi:CRP-like cAMP-binding protein